MAFKIKKYNIVISIMTAYLSLIGLTQNYIVNNNPLVPANSFITIIFFILLFFALQNIFCSPNLMI